MSTVRHQQRPRHFLGSLIRCSSLTTRPPYCFFSTGVAVELEAVTATVNDLVDDRHLKVTQVDVEGSEIFVVLQASSGAYPRDQVDEVSSALEQLDGITNAKVQVTLTTHLVVA